MIRCFQIGGWHARNPSLVFGQTRYRDPLRRLLPHHEPRIRFPRGRGRRRLKRGRKSRPSPAWRRFHRHAAAGRLPPATPRGRKPRRASPPERSAGSPSGPPWSSGSRSPPAAAEATGPRPTIDPRGGRSPAHPFFPIHAAPDAVPLARCVGRVARPVAVPARPGRLPRRPSRRPRDPCPRRIPLPVDEESRLSGDLRRAQREITGDDRR